MPHSTEVNKVGDVGQILHFVIFRFSGFGKGGGKVQICTWKCAQCRR